MNWIANALEKKGFEEYEMYEFYRDIFKEGELDIKDEQNKGKYTGIAVSMNKTQNNKNRQTRHHVVTDELGELLKLKNSKKFCVTSPISYCGKSRSSRNARFMYALVVEIDDIVPFTKKANCSGIDDLIHQMNMELIPTATYVVASGNGIHLYYVFERSLCLFPNVITALKKYKRFLTTKLWNRYITNSHEEKKIQYESAFQGFRMVGTRTKEGILTNTADLVRAFKVGEEVSIDYMNSFLGNPKKLLKEHVPCVIPIAYKSKLTLAEAKIKYPEWYESRIIKQEPKKQWFNNTALYEWWIRQIKEGAIEGKRYHCIFVLTVYAIKCNVPFERLEKDAFSLLELFESKTTSENNHFTEDDIFSAISCYDDKTLATFPINSIYWRTGIKIEKNKRNKRKQELHLKLARSNQEILDSENNTNWRERNGRPVGTGTKEEKIKSWRIENPNKSKADCNRDTGIDPKTIRKWW